MIKEGIIQNFDIYGVTFNANIIPKYNDKSRPQIPMAPTSITVHNTGNARKGADAKMHTRYVDNTINYTSWHFTVDDKEIYQELPINEVAWHAGDGANGRGNKTSIGIEICENDGIDWNKAKDNAIRLIVWLRRNIAGIKGVFPHRKWSGKYCPHKILDEGWDKFIEEIEIFYHIKIGGGKEMGWEQDLGMKSIDNLSKKGLIDSGDTWKKKNLTKEAPLWTMFTLFDRIADKLEAKLLDQDKINLDDASVLDEYLVVIADALNVRDEVRGNKVGVVMNGDKLLRQDSKEGWYQIVKDDLSGWVHGDYVKKYDATVDENYRSIRKYDSSVHIFEAPIDKFIIDVTLGKQGVYERLSMILPDVRKESYANKDVICAINAGFFGGREHQGTYVDEESYYFPPDKQFIDFIYYKDGTTEIKFIAGIAEAIKLQENVNWAIGTSWALVINGEKTTLNADKIYHSKTRQPRTLLGQKRDGTFVLVVVDGRGKNNSKGITAHQSSQLMKGLGCYNAVNLDGGGSSEMVVKDEIKNYPSDGEERSIGSAILIYKK